MTIQTEAHVKYLWVFSNGYRFDSLKLYDYNSPYGIIPVNESMDIAAIAIP